MRVSSARTAAAGTSPLSLHDALPISGRRGAGHRAAGVVVRQSDDRQLRQRAVRFIRAELLEPQDRKSTRLNSSHLGISYAVFCLKKKSERIGPWPRRRPRIVRTTAFL